ncbi:MAG: DUF1598 domain-containing protein [Pirellulales bacterium]|nr:DUF1598 domain-containing protein [Pirellulales bacterium]
MMSHRATKRIAGIFALMALAFTFQLVNAGNNGFFRNNSVGGISINSDGVVSNVDLESRKLLLKEMRQNLKPAEGKMAAKTELRMVSLRGLEAAIADAVQNGQGALPDEVRFLAGLQRIQYVFVYPEQRDIVLAGPGEGWKIDDNANVVGMTPGPPVLLLDNLLSAMRAVNAPQPERISCSIDPTKQGQVNYKNTLNHLRRAGVRNPNILAPQLKRAMGNQTVSINGVSGDTHFARILVAADIRMKQIAMELDDSKVLPGFITSARNSVSVTNTNINPRWWLACNYESVARGADGLAWEIRGQGVKAMTESELYQQDGQVQAAGKDPAAEKWAKMMTERYNALGKEEPVFTELRNVMDMCVAAAVIRNHNLLPAAELKLPHLLGQQVTIPTEAWHTPREVSTQTSFIKTSRGLVVTASGGVDIDYLSPTQNPTLSPEVRKVWEKAESMYSAGQWWN